MKVIDTLWFDEVIGIVKAKDPVTGEIKFYIGRGEGLSEEDDIAYIIALGSKFKKQTLLSFLNK